MARPRSDEKRTAILEAAIEVVADEGLAATTAAIARRAGVSHGSVFHYFGSKADLLNVAYLQVKIEMHQAVLSELPEVADPVVQLRHLWERWMQWGISNPVRRRAHVRLMNEDVITQRTRDTSKASIDRAIRIVQAVSSKGVFRKQPIEFVAHFFEALAAATMDAMLAQPTRADEYCETSFRALVQALK